MQIVDNIYLSTTDNRYPPCPLSAAGRAPAASARAAATPESCSRSLLMKIGVIKTCLQTSLQCLNTMQCHYK